MAAQMKNLKTDSLLDNIKSFLKKKPGKLKFKRTPRIYPPLAPQRAYLKDLRPILNAMSQVTLEVIKPSLGPILSEAERSRPTGDSVRRFDDFVDTIERTFKTARILFYRKYTDKEVESIAQRAARNADSFNLSQINKVFGAVLNVQLPGNETWLGQEIKAFTKTNVELIKSIPEQYFQRIERQVTRAAQTGTLGSDLTKIIAKEYDVSANRARLIARDQVSKFNSDLTKTRQLSVGVKKYEWSTSNDERVRPSHEEKEGKKFFWDDPPSDTGNPGEDINCRCVALPIFE